jgi:hypothetical protein
MNTDTHQAPQLPQDAVMQSVLKASDLRIGNLVTMLTKNPKKEKPFFTDEIHKIDSNDFYYFDDEVYKPIPLNEEWLFKFGFKYNGFNYDFERFIFHAQGKKEDGSFYNIEFYIRRNRKNFLISLIIDYVHQLQNLYFALTQRELTVA